MAKSKTQREAEQLLTIASVLPKWRRGLAAYHKAIGVLEAGADTDIDPVIRARDRLHKLLGEAAGYAPGSYLDPSVVTLDAEMRGLPNIADALEKGKAARLKGYEAESKRLREEEREARRPYDWMRK